MQPYPVEMSFVSDQEACGKNAEPLEEGIEAWTVGRNTMQAGLHVCQASFALERFVSLDEN